MSFSSEIKDRISQIENECSNCDREQLGAMIIYSGRIRDKSIVLSTENESVAVCMKRLMGKFSDDNIDLIYSDKSRLYEVSADENILDKVFSNIFKKTEKEDSDCCIRAYIRGAFLAGGSVSDPHKSYHFEFDAKYEPEAHRLKKLLEQTGIPSKITCRKKRYVVYIKEYGVIADILGVIGDTNAAFDIYNISIEKDLRNNINRQNNCENANMDKIADAYQKHLVAIEKIKKTIGLSKLPEVLQEIARVRLEYPIGKSGVNHRLNRIVEISEQL